MAPLAYAAAPDIAAAVGYAARNRGAEFIAGGTDMLQLLQEHVRTPEALIDINGLPLSGISFEPAGLRIGALTRMAELAADERVHAGFPVITEALLASASPQVRNMASIGGNLLQRTRCLYFRDVATPCNKRSPGSGCPAQDGLNRMNAIFGGSPHCIAAYPGDLAVALTALEAGLEIAGPEGRRTLPLAELYRRPGETPQVETTLAPGELIAAVTVPASPIATRSRYLKVRDRASFEFALASAAVALDAEAGVIRQARVAVGGVATTPWRLPAVEEALAGQQIGADLFRRAAALAGNGADPRPNNAFKVELVKRTVERALKMAGGEA